MKPVKRLYAIIAGVAVLIASLVFLIVPRYIEISKISEEIENKLGELESAYRRYVNQKKAIEDLKFVIKEPVKIDLAEFRGLRFRKTRNGFEITGKTDGAALMTLLDEVTRNPSAYFEEIYLKNTSDNPITISGATSSEVEVKMRVKTLELRE